MLSSKHQADGIGINPVFLRQDAGGERFGRVARLDGDNGLRHDGPGIEVFVHEVHGAAGEVHTSDSSAWRCASSPGKDGSSDG